MAQAVKLLAEAIDRQRAGVRLWQSAGTNLPNGAGTVLSWDREDYDDQGFHTGSSSDVVIPSAVGPGRYTITAQVAYSPNTSGYRSTSIRKNGATISTTRVAAIASGAVAAMTNASVTVDLVPGDTVSILCTHNAGVALSTIEGSVSTFFEVRRSG